MSNEAPEFPEEEEMLLEELENSPNELVEVDPEAEAETPPEPSKIEGEEVDEPEVPLAGEFAVKKVIRLDANIEEQRQAVRDKDNSERRKRSGQGYNRIIS